MSENIEGKVCIWKQVSDRDKAKLQSGNTCITLSDDKPCHNCDGTKEYAQMTGCTSYTIKGERR